ncbi:hypothetical protein CDD83_2721 [Cordyceps sp. RAO-2017]|nr:hypothetical protein CDD83_2721 [Cordyceps sp. RAO-2017]
MLRNCTMNGGTVHFGSGGGDKRGGGTPGGETRKPGHGRCCWCRRRGHKSKDCIHAAAAANANATYEARGDGDGDGNGGDGGNGSGSEGETQERQQMQKLLQELAELRRGAQRRSPEVALTAFEPLEKERQIKALHSLGLLRLCPLGHL